MSLDLERTYPVIGGLDDIVGPSDEPYTPFTILVGPVPCIVEPSTEGHRHPLVVGADVFHEEPRRLRLQAYGDVPLLVRGKLGPALIDYAHIVGREGLAHRAEFHVGTWEVPHHQGALGLTISVAGSSVRLVPLFHAIITSGFNGSPALIASLRCLNLYAEMSSRIRILQTVGGAQNVVTWCSLDQIRDAPWPQNGPRNVWPSTVAPMRKGEKEELHANFAQPGWLML